MLQRFLLITLTLCSLTASAQWQQTGSKVRYVNGLGIPTKDTAAGVSADSSQIVIRPADSSLYVKYKRTWLRVGGGAGGGSIGGTGTINTVAKFTASGFIGNSQIFDNGTNVGIGTTSPGAKLDVSGTFRTNGIGANIGPVSAGTSQNYFRFLSTGSDFYVGTESSVGGAFFTGTNAYDNVLYSSTPQNFIVSGVSRMYIAGNGNIGIGTKAPEALLHVNGSFTLGETGSTARQSLFTQNTTGTGYLNIQSLQQNVGYTPIVLNSLGGNVGIGTTNPVAKLNLYDGTNPLSIKILRTSVPVYVSDVQLAASTAAASISHNIENISNGSLTWSSIQNPAYSASSIFLNSTTSNSYISFLTASAVNTAPTEKVRITGGGNVLIGTTTDNGVDKLQVSGSILTSNTGIKVGSTATSIASDGSSLYLNASGNTYLNTASNAYVTNAGSVTASGTLTAATLVKSGGTSSQALMADGSVLTLSSGTYTPTITNNNGTSGLTLYAATYQRIGNIVTVYFLVSGTCTASLVNAFNMTIPFGNVFTNIQQVQGTGFSGTNNLSAYITALNGNTIATVNFSVPASVTTFDMKGSFQYQVQ